MSLCKRTEVQSQSARRLSDGDILSMQSEVPAGLDEEAFFELSSELYCRLYRSSLIEVVNSAFQTMLGRHASDCVGHALREWVHPGDREAFMAALADIDAGGKPLVLATRVRHVAGGYVPVRWRMVRWAESICMLGTDQRPYRTLHDALREAREKAESAEGAKAAFFEMMSHEMRTPLNPIVGFTDLLLDDSSLSAEQREAVESVRRSARQLTSVLGDIIEYSRIEAREFSFVSEPFLVCDLMRCARETYSPLAEEQGIVWGVDHVGMEDTLFLGDHRCLRNALFKLIDNAFKFTPGGSVRARVLRKASRGAVHRIRFEVTDTGIGVAPTDQEKIFEPFFQVDRGLDRGYEGTGMGLATLRKIVERHGGDFGVRSGPGEGSCFWFEVEMPEVERPPEDLPRRLPVLAEVAGEDRKRVFVLHTDGGERARMQRLLKLMGHRVVSVSEGRELLEELRETMADIVFVDTASAECGKFDVLAAARRTFGSALPPVAVLSGENSIEARERSLCSGADYFLPDPVGLPDLRNVFRKLRGEEVCLRGGSNGGMVSP